ncbi:hypothetical protein EYF80_010946 [Liparis tanakae]|uniref:Uncharacterized protein n=1 Tax=Liparis tanakae TaxID=230148 RepID=A0A4Z2ILK3_9TELE|nr:hypothetical protein EYF80_010946 [Liparis tanakae]
MQTLGTSHKRRETHFAEVGGLTEIGIACTEPGQDLCYQKLPRVQALLEVKAHLKHWTGD